MKIFNTTVVLCSLTTKLFGQEPKKNKRREILGIDYYLARPPQMYA
jgi:hypothetical protein